jgi:hypothetical protein
MIVAAIANRTIEKATEAYTDAGIDSSVIEEVKTAEELETVFKAGYGASLFSVQGIVVPFDTHGVVLCCGVQWPRCVCLHRPADGVGGH